MLCKPLLGVGGLRAGPARRGAPDWGGLLTPTSRRCPPQLQGAQRKLQEQEGEFRARERGLLGSLEEVRGAEKQQLDHSRSLELKLEAARAEAAELGLRLSAAEGRAQGLEAELARVEAQRRAAEAQLGGLRSALRRGLGLGRSPSPAPLPSPGSPARNAPTGGEQSAKAGKWGGGAGACLAESPPVATPPSRSAPPASPPGGRAAPLLDDEPQSRPHVTFLPFGVLGEAPPLR